MGLPDIPSPEPAGLETPSMKAARLRWEERQRQRQAARQAQQAEAAEGEADDGKEQFESNSTLVTVSMRSDEEEAKFNKSKTCVSGQCKAQLAKPGPPGFKDNVERTLKYDAETAIKTGRASSHKSYKVIKPYFQY